MSWKVTAKSVRPSSGSNTFGSDETFERIDGNVINGIASVYHPTAGHSRGMQVWGEKLTGASLPVQTHGDVQSIPPPEPTVHRKTSVGGILWMYPFPRVGCTLPGPGNGYTQNIPRRSSWGKTVQPARN